MNDQATDRAERSHDHWAVGPDEMDGGLDINREGCGIQDRAGNHVDISARSMGRAALRTPLQAPMFVVSAIRSCGTSLLHGGGLLPASHQCRPRGITHHYDGLVASTSPWQMCTRDLPHVADSHRRQRGRVQRRCGQTCRVRQRGEPSREC